MVNLQSSDVGKLIHFEYLSKFDLTLEKQTKIAAKKDPNDPQKIQYGEEAWFLILEHLHNYLLKTLEILIKKSLGKIDLKERISRLRDFIM